MLLRPQLSLTGVRALEHVLEALVRESVDERKTGKVPALSAAPSVRYKREPRGVEKWQTAAQTYRRGVGDCEDLAVWLCADFRVRGIPARVVVRNVRPGLSHALVRVQDRHIDPSKARGMSRKAEG